MKQITHDILIKLKEHGPAIAGTATGVGVSFINWSNVVTSLVSGVLVFLSVYLLRKLFDKIFGK